MTNLNDVLLAMSNIPVVDPIAEIWGRGLQGGYTVIEYTGALPITINANGEPLIDYRIYGNTVQTGTPTPENPIMPIGCGERTANFWNFQPSAKKYGVTLTWNGAKIVFSGICTSSANFIKSITLSAGTYTIKANANRIPVENNNSCVNVYNVSPYMFADIPNRNATNGIANFTLGEETTVSLRIRVQEDVNYDGFTLEPMLNSGSTALPYEPYGYKLPILSNSTVTNIYLGEVQTTRRIKKLVLTGEENYNWLKSATRNYSWYIFPNEIGTIPYTPFYCSHGETATNVSDYGYGKVYCDNTLNLGIFDSSINSSAKLNAYLAQQYAAGTPVTVWYVLAEPETGIVNEPLMKIDDYADTLSMEQAGVSIPTAAGTTVIDYDGTPKPSQMYIKYLEVKND